MSVELILIPLAVAAVAAWQARPEHSDQEMLVETRMRDPQMLMSACTMAGAVSVDAQGVTAHWPSLSISFTPREDGSLAAHVSGTDDLALISDAVKSIDREYGMLVQARVLERLEANAPTMGVTLASRQENPDGSVTLVLEVNQ